MNQYSWSEIESQLTNLTSVEGGYSNAKRGLITLKNGKRMFVKLGVDENTKGWGSKEIRVYNFLRENSYPHIPALLSVNEDQNEFALEALLPEAGWDWQEKWDNQRLLATLKAMDDLAAIKPDVKHAELFKSELTDAENGWVKLAASKELQSAFEQKLKGAAAENIIQQLPFHAEKSRQFIMRHDTLVHDDVRADNAAWNAARAEVKIVDWTWVELGDRRIDLAAMLVHVQKSGFDILPKYAERLDSGALHWLAGFWIASASKPIWPGGPEKLRELQLKAGITALSLASKI